MNDDEKLRLQQLGVDYAEAMERFGGNEALYRKLIGAFPDDPHFAQLQAALETPDLSEAHQAAHALKGVAGTLSFSALYRATCTMNDALREGDAERARAALSDVESAYSDALAALALLNVYTA